MLGINPPVCFEPRQRKGLCLLLPCRFVMTRRLTHWDRGFTPPEGRFRPPNDRDMESVIKEMVAEAVQEATAPLIAQLDTLTAQNEELEARIISLGQRTAEELEARIASLEKRPAEELETRIASLEQRPVEDLEARIVTLEQRPTEEMEARIVSLEQRPAEERTDTIDALKEMERSAADSDNNLRRRNVVVSGISAPQGKAESDTLELFGKMGLKIGPNDVASARPLSASENAAIIVEFNKQKHAEAALKAGRGFASAKIKPDYCTHTRRARGLLFGTLLRLKATASGRATTPPPKLMGARIVDGECTYRWHARREAVEYVRRGESPTYSPLEPVPAHVNTASVSLPETSTIDSGPPPSPKRRREPGGSSPESDPKRTASRRSGPPP